MNNNNCRYCGEEIDQTANGNRKYCNDECYLHEKLERQKGKRDQVATARKNKMKAERILRVLMERHGEGNWFDPKEAEKLELDFSLCDKIQLLNEQRAVVIGEFAYLLPNATKMSIYKS